MSATKKHVLMIDNYDSFTWNLYQYLCQSSLCSRVDVFRNDAIDIERIEQEIRPDIIFISPGPGHPSSDLGISRDVIKHFMGKIPIFGVCMGLQCIFDVFGGDVSYAGEIVHGKTTTITHDGKGMFKDVPQHVAVTRYHSLAGTLKSLPDCLEITANTETSPDVIMGVRHKKYTIEGVQFHPESILTQEGRLMIDNLLSFSAGTWAGNDLNATLDVPDSALKKESILDVIYSQRQRDYEIIEAIPGRRLGDLQVNYDMGLAPPLINFYDRMVYARDHLHQTIILSEFKRASPSKGDININAHPAVQSQLYAQNGCAVISVLTEPKWFKGSIEDMVVVRQAIDKNNDTSYQRPAVLRKEFIFNEYQILEARLHGADTVLLIVKMLDQKLLENLYQYSSSLGMNPLVEVNNAAELDRALKLEFNESTDQPLIIGVNNRNLTTFDVDLNTTTLLVKQAKSSLRTGDVLVLALLGITSVDDVVKYKTQDKVDGFLIGESLMRAQERGEAAKFLSELTKC